MDNRDTAADSESDDTYPALKYQRLLGLDNIGVWWTMPDGKTMKEMETELWNGILNSGIDLHVTLAPESTAKNSSIAQKFQEARGYLDTLISLNPPLNEIHYNPDKWGDIRGLLHGIVSGFNTDDIQSWTDNRHCSDYEQFALNERIAEQFIYKNVDIKINASSHSIPPELKKEFQSNAVALLQNSLSEFINVKWSPSRKTIREIHRQLDEKYGPVTPQNQTPATLTKHHV